MLFNETPDSRFRFTSDAHPAHLTELQVALLEEAAPYAKFPYDILYSNLWLFKHPIAALMSRMELVSPQMRTTSAVTVIQGEFFSVAHNNAVHFVSMRTSDERDEVHVHTNFMSLRKNGE